MTPAEETSHCMPQELLADSLEASLTVNRLEDSVAWYGNTLGIVVDRRYERDGKLIAVSLRAGAVWSLDTEPVTMPHGARILRLRDPDGFRLTVSSTPAA